MEKIKKKGIKLVIFDLWRTLATRKHNYDSLILMMNHFNLNISREKFRKLFEESIQKKKWISKRRAYKHLAKNMQIPVTRENINWLKYRRDKDESKVYLFKHTIPMLKSLKNQKIKTAILSNSTYFSIKVLKKQTNLLKYVNCPMFSFQYQDVKPNKKGFEKLLKKYNIKPSQAIMIGDSLIDDIRPAKKYGLNAIHFKNYNQLKKDLKKFELKI